jgi:hypothetical protein
MHTETNRETVMKYKILQIIPADGWVVRGRKDLFWRDTEGDYPEDLRDSHIVTHTPVVCFALMEHSDSGEYFVEPMVSFGAEIVLLYTLKPDLNTNILRDSRIGWVHDRCECGADGCADTLTSGTDMSMPMENPVCPLPDDEYFFSRDNMPIRVSNSLKKAGVVTVQQICQMTERDFSYMVSFGKISLNDLKNALARHGLKLRC